YLDHAGATVPSQTAIREFSETMCQSLFGNPHSQSRVSLATADRVQAVRTAVLAWLGTTERTYSVIFTANATAALKLAGECFPWQNDGSHFWYHDMAHTSLLGVRELALKAGAHTNDIPTNNPFHLFAYPAQCNYSGARFPLSWSTQIKQRASTKPCRRALQYLPKGPWWVLLDAASYLTTSTLNLNSDENSVDMVALSFYKVFGFPTGLGALIVHNRLAPYFQKSYFGGGTVTAAIASEPWQRYRSQLSDKFEDGTVNYGDIIALQHAMNRWQMLFSPAPRLAFHTAALSIYSLRRMAQELVHPTGQPLCTWYLDPALVQLATQPNLGDPAGLITLWLAHQGPILNFNLRRGDGNWIGYAEVAQLATLYRLAIRTGGACNPGAQEHWLQLTPGQIKSNLERGHVCWDDHDLVDNQPTGSVRISFGASSRFEDVDRWIRFLATQFLESSIDLTQSSQNLIAKPTINPATADIRLRGLAIFPIKSCHGMSIHPDKSWPVTEHGLMYDRAWSVIDARTHRAIGQKRYPRMCLVRPVVDTHTQTLKVSAPDHPDLRIGLSDHKSASEVADCRVCGDQTHSIRYLSERINDWFSSVMGFPCYLVRQLSPLQPDTNGYPSPTDIPDSLVGSTDPYSTPHRQPGRSFANESSYLLVSENSAAELGRWVRQRSDEALDIEPKFRANIVIGSESDLVPFAEDGWKAVMIGGQYYETVKPCKRCQMICIDQETGQISKEPFSTLSVHRNDQGKVNFGQHLRHV
ncbi:pyridoxal phosphate-dependent transferase, partial [Dimargaris cristalligena]